MSEKLPRRVPLPDVGQHTDDIVFGNLGLPVGFDQERLLINLRAIDRTMSFAGIGHLTIASGLGEAGTYDISPGSINSDGTTTTAASSKREKESTSVGNVTFDRNSLFGDAEARIELNNAEIKARIHEKSGLAGEFDPKIQAAELNEAIRSGLGWSSFHANYDNLKLFQFLTFNGNFAVLAMISNMSHESKVAFALAFPQVLMYSALFLSDCAMLLVNDEGQKPFEAVRGNRKSIFCGIALDRIALANARMTGAKLVSAT